MTIKEEWRDLWSYKIEYLIACSAFVFSLTNLCELPYNIAYHGGPAFVVAYGVCLVAFCLPVLIMELAVGQLTGRGPVQALYNVCPLFKGVGAAQVLYSLTVMSTMAVKVGYLLWFLFYLFWTVGEPETPWLSCEPRWLPTALTSCTPVNGTRIDNIGIDDSSLLPGALTLPSSSIMRFLEHIRNSRDSIVDIGEIQWRPIAAEGAVWVVVFLSIFAGVRWLGKVLYLTFLIPIGLMLVLILKCALMDGWLTFIDRLFLIDWNELTEPRTNNQVWRLALRQAIYATGVGTGGFIALGSYSRRRNNLVGDAIFVILFHIFAVVCQFAVAVGVMGVAANTIGYHDDPAIILSNGDTQLYNLLAALSHFSMTKIWSGVLLILVVFILLNFMMILTLMVLSTVEDALGEKASHCCPRLLLSFFICALASALGLIHTTQAGKYTQLLMNDFLDYVTLWVILTFEIIAVAWFYCGHRLGKDIRSMVSNGCCWIVGHFFMFLLYLLPLVPLWLVVAQLWEYTYPPEDARTGAANAEWRAIASWQWSEAVGWAIAVAPLLPIPLYMIYCVVASCCCTRSEHVTKCQRLRETVTSPLRYELLLDDYSGSRSHQEDGRPGYQSTAPGYILLPQRGSKAPLAQPEHFTDIYGNERSARVSNL